MKKLIIVVSILLQLHANAQQDTSKMALLLIDIQNFYFPGGGYELENPVESSIKAKKLLDYFRDKNQLIIHIRHNSKSGGEIHKNVKPLESEKVISKNYANCFKDTELLNYLKENQVNTLVICGMQTHMCVEAATRAAADYDFQCILVHDACATRNLKFEDKEITAEQVHNSTLNTLKSYAKVIDTETFLKKY